MSDPGMCRTQHGVMSCLARLNERECPLRNENDPRWNDEYASVRNFRLGFVRIADLHAEVLEEKGSLGCQCNARFDIDNQKRVVRKRESRVQGRGARMRARS